MEPIVEYLRRKLREAGHMRFDAISRETGVAQSFMRKFVCNGGRDNPRVQTIQPLLDLFVAIERGERALPPPVIAEPSPKREPSDL